MLSVATVLLLWLRLSPAYAIDRQCGRNQFWNPTQGACVKKPARKLSTDDKWHRAIDILEGKAGKTPAGEALKLLETGCSDNHAPSCETLAFLYARGRSVGQDLAQAAILYDKACALGSLDGCVAAAQLAMRNNHPDVARKNYGLACERGAGAACARGAEMADQGAGGGADPAEAKRLFSAAFAIFSTQCPAVNTACAHLGLLYFKGHGVTADKNKAYQAWVQGCSAGSGDACYFQGVALEEGIGIANDKDAALAYFDRACVQYDHAGACTTHAQRLAVRGMNIPIALYQAQRACELDDSECGTSAAFYASGTGVAVDNTKANELFAKACERSETHACVQLGDRRRDGLGGPADATAAVKAFDRACAAGDATGCARAAQVLAKSTATSATAFRFADLACDRNNGAGCMLASELAASGKHGKPADVERAFRLAVRGCAQNYPTACAMVGEAYEKGVGVERDASHALEHYRKACEGDATTLKASACEALARLLWDSPDVHKEPAEALSFAIRACLYSQGEACSLLPVYAVEAKPDDETKRKAMAALAQACHDHTEQACVLQGDQLAQGGVFAEKAPKAAFDIYAQSCSRKYVRACDRQAAAYANGFGVATDVSQATTMWKELCDQQYANACISLAGMYRTQQRYDEAMPLLLQACDQKFGDACNTAAYSYYAQQGAKWDVIAAGKLYQRACEHGYTIGCTNVGELYEFGVGVPSDAQQAAAYYDKGCTTAEPSGCGRFARMLAAGQGVAKDLIRAEAMFRRACTANEPEACRELADLLESAPMPPRAEIARLRAAAHQGATAQARDNPYYMWVMGKFTRDGIGIVKNNQAATEWFAKACDGYDPMGCLDAGTAFAQLAGSANRDRAKLYFERACGAGVEAGCLRLAGKHPGQLNAKGCGGCNSRSDSTTLFGILVVAALGWQLTRRRLRRDA